MKKKGLIIYSNGSESFLNFLGRFDSFRQSQLLSSEYDLEQRGFFWAHEGDVVVSLSSLSEPLLNMNRELQGYQNVSSMSLSEFSSTEAFHSYVNGHCISPYAYTESFHEMTQKLSLNSVEKPLSCEVVQWLDSKIGFHTEMKKLNLSDRFIKVPEYVIAKSYTGVVAIANKFARQGKGVVVKVDDGESGLGMRFIENVEELDGVVDVLSLAEQYVVVEEMINIHVDPQISSPSLEYYIDDSGFSFLYSCGQCLRKGEFLGVSLGVGSLPNELLKRLMEVGDVIASHYFHLGYRGYFDIDFVVSKDLEVCPIETNMRRTGGTHIYDIANRVFGYDWHKTNSLLSNDNYVYGSMRMCDDTLIELVRPLYFDQNTGRGIVVTLLGREYPRLGYVSIGESLDVCESISMEFQELFR